uniref:Putative ml domain salivary peptide n=1 Tax=Corethrella appendiculata TaxID=1370023 RepID=U5EWT0_9DIPT
MFRYLILVAFLPAMVFGVEFNRCPAKPAPLDLRVHGCSVQPCELVRGQDTVFEIDFTAQSNVKALDTKVYATVNGIKLPYALDSKYSKACNHLVATACPLDESEEVTVKLSIPVLKIYPKISLNIEISLVNENEPSIVHSCFNLDTKVVD